MEQIINKFKKYMIQRSKSENTIKNYILHINVYIKWFEDTYGTNFKKLYRENVLKYKSKSLNGNTINAKLSSLGLFNKFLIEEKMQSDIVVKDDDMIKIQTSYSNPTDISKADVENFRERILESRDKRLYTIVTLLSYAGLRIWKRLMLR